MSLEEKIISTFKQKNSKLAEVFNQAFELFEQKGFPTKKNEDWKYTSLKKLLKTDYSLVTEINNNIEAKDVEPFFIGADTYKVVLVDGFYNADLSHVDTDKITISSMQDAIENNAELVEKHFAKVADNNQEMVALNTISFNDGVFVNIPNNVILDKPIEVINIATGVLGDTLIQPRNLIVVGKNADAKLIERHQNISENTILTNSVTEISVGENAYYYHYKIQNDTEVSNLVDNTFVDQNRYSNAYVDTFAFGGNVTRNNLSFLLNGENAVANLDGISLLNKNQHVDNFTFVDHRVPNCDSNELYKGIYDDKSKGVFTGKVMIRKDAQNTKGDQQNNNILLSENAQINAKPQMEIYADDVKAAHGCTIGQLDDDALFFMRQRCIPLKEAKAMLMYAFASEALKNVKVEELKTQINKQIAQKLGVNIEFGV
ncbi:MAG: Fe-S cluster assembly protein SufD [Ichthyobacteriaceae bacterium]|nr:Fe-S cluster assembly protein SufD [Ichthyobacteriaceae bacterium]